MMGLSSYLLLCGVAVGVVAGEDHQHPRPWAGKTKSAALTEENKDFWLKKGEDELQEALSLKPNTNLAKNIILFIGDGMSLATVTAARVYKGQQAEGKSAQLSWEKLPNVGLSKTYDVDYMVPDSAATAFAMYSGVKTTGYTMGYDNTIDYLKPGSALDATPVTTILDWAQEAGKKTGFVTNTRMSHATPGALYAKTTSRFWECENDVVVDIEDGLVTQDEIDKYKPEDITLQLVESEAGKNIDIMLGGGRASWLPQEETRWDYDTDDWNCTRLDGRNLIEEWKGNHTGGIYIENRTELMDMDMTKAESVLGIFTNSYVTWDDLVNDTNDKPRLEDMAVQAVKFLQAKSDSEGYFIMIEGGRIDAAHHNGQAVRALSETLAFDKAVEEVLKVVDFEDTLVILTADHSHTMTIGGYTGREQDIAGVVKEADGLVDLGEDGETFTVLSYGNGPGFMQFNGTGVGDFTFIDRDTMEEGTTAGMSYLQASAAPVGSETHAGDDVGIWAAGPMAHLFHGVHEQSYIGHVMSYAACIGPQKGRERCVNYSASSGSDVG
eukprot:TRINITY_DN42321_c0_g1_i1.p1 TRINITY_DN42321_c0_g1~~TRINITY_DN42321_c0_g1_i1.p1  ORF type:complete len:552 (-),score=154.93 TRINITY_DN42321_c0_g1_i1:143-1798(-)